MGNTWLGSLFSPSISSTLSQQCFSWTFMRSSKVPLYGYLVRHNREMIAREVQLTFDPGFGVCFLFLGGECSAHRGWSSPLMLAFFGGPLSPLQHWIVVLWPVSSFKQGHRQIWDEHNS